MDQSVNIPWAPGMDYGMGVNLLNGQIAGKGVDPGEIKGGAGGQIVTYDMMLINTMEEFYSSIGISVEVSGSYGLFSADGKFKYSKEAKFNSQSTFLLARCVVQNPFTQCEDAQIRPNAGELIKQGKTDVFQLRFGDGFVRGMLTGGEFFAVISITSSSREEQTFIAASLQAKYGGFFASGSVDTSLDDATKSRIARNEIRVSTYQRGGQGAEQGFTGDVEAVMARLQAFPGAVLHNPVPYAVQVANYKTLDLPEGPNLIDIQAQKEALEDYSKIHMHLMTVRNDIEFLQLHPEYFVNPPSAATLNQWEEFIAEQINQLTRHASKCVDSPKDGCGLFPLKLPDGFAMPERKLHSSKPVVIYELENFTGHSQTLLVGKYDDANDELNIGNDALSSIQVPEGLVARLYEHFHFQGRFIDIGVDTPAVSSFWNDKTSSIMVFEASSSPPLTKEVIVFDHADYAGISQSLVTGRYDGIEKSLKIGNDTLSSALVPKGMVLRLYEHASFQGSFVEIKEDTPAVSMDWNDRTSSIIVYEEQLGLPLG